MFKKTKTLKEYKKIQIRKIFLTKIIFLLSVFFIISYFIYNKMIKHQPLISEDNTVGDIQNLNPKIKEVQRLKKINNDLYGWIKIEGTKIDYPIMYKSGNDYYLYRDFYKKYHQAGSIFIDKHNKIKPVDTNIIIHGHSMKDGTMFKDLLKYKSKEFYEKHKNITIYTTKEKQEYEIISVFISKIYKKNENVFKYYKFYNIINRNEYNYYIYNIQKLSLYKNYKEVVYPTNLITLSTCEYSKKNGRLVVVAKLLDTKT